MTWQGSMALLAMLAALPVWAHQDGLCAAEETTFFACVTAQARQIALCGRLGQKELQYRFGTGNRTEFRFPGNVAGGVDEFWFAHYFRYQTDRIEIRFMNRGVDYTVFDYHEEGQRRAGVRVELPEGRQQEFRCAGRVTSRLAELKSALRCDADSALNLGSCP